MPLMSGPFATPLNLPENCGRLMAKVFDATSVGGNTSQQDFAMLVSVYGQEAGVVQIELMYNAKINEVAVAQRSIKRVTGHSNLAQSLPGGFSLDALHSRTETLSLLESRHCHYIVGLKRNQKNLYQQAEQLTLTMVPLSESTHIEQNHGRQTRKTVRFPNPIAYVPVTQIP